MLHVESLERPRILPHAGNGSLGKYRLSESRIMDLVLMNVLRADANSRRHVDIKLGFIWEAHNSPRLANSTSCVEDEVLVGPPVDPNKDTVAPPDSFAGDSPIHGIYP